MKRRSRIVFAGFLVRNPLGGYFWQTAHYLVGLQSLGHEVWFYEDTSGYQFAYNPMGDETGYSYGYGLEAVARFFGRIGFAHSWVFVDTQSGYGAWAMRRTIRVSSAGGRPPGGFRPGKLPSH